VIADKPDRSLKRHSNLIRKGWLSQARQGEADYQEK
jgi:hypothetical protein